MDRIDMSLDDIIKQNRKDKKKQLRAVRAAKAAKIAGRGRGRGRGQAVRGRGGVRLQTQGRMKAFRSKFGTGHGTKRGGANVRGRFGRGGRVTGAKTKTGVSPMNRQSQGKKVVTTFDRNLNQQGQRKQQTGQRRGIGARRANAPTQRQNQQLINAANKRKAQARRNLFQAGKIQRQQKFSQRRGVDMQTQGNQGLRRQGRGRGSQGNFTQTQPVDRKAQRTRRWRGQLNSSAPLPAKIMTVSVTNPRAQTSKPVRINRQTASSLSDRFGAVRSAQRGGGPRNRQRQTQAVSGRTVVMV